MENPFTQQKAPPMMTPTDYQVSQNQITRQQQLADLLRQQSLTPMGNTEMVSGWAVKKSPLAGLEKLAQALGANYAQKNVDESTKKYAADYQAGAMDTMKRGAAAANGTPATASDFTPDTFDAEDKPGFGGMATINPGQAPDPSAAASIKMRPFASMFHVS